MEAKKKQVMYRYSFRSASSSYDYSSTIDNQEEEQAAKQRKKRVHRMWSCDGGIERR